MNRPAKFSMREFDSSHEAIRIATRIIDLIAQNNGFWQIMITISACSAANKPWNSFIYVSSIETIWTHPKHGLPYYELIKFADYLSSVQLRMSCCTHH